MGEADDVYQAFSNVVSEDSGNVISDENNRNLQYKDIYNIHVPKARDKIVLDIDSIEKLQKECKKIKEAKYPYAEICLGIASLLLGAFLSALISQVTYELKFLSVLFYSICPVGGIGCSVAYWFLRKNNVADAKRLAERVEEYLVIPSEESEG
ncbi:hypothetical protein [Frisingicoccus sp.]|uniref:hypothetical protein n=1 Tax=Frisingicoccus sp. TaxID=1918627 RepID=UPI003AB4D84D